MLKKTELIFQSDVIDMWLNYTKFKRNLHSVLSVFSKFYLFEGCWRVAFNRDMFVCHMYVEDYDSKEEIEKDWDATVNYLIKIGFNPAFDVNDSEWKFFISMDNFVEAITQR